MTAIHYFQLDIQKLSEPYEMLYPHAPDQQHLTAQTGDKSLELQTVSFFKI